MTKPDPNSPAYKAADPLRRLEMCEEQMELILQKLAEAGHPCKNLIRGSRTQRRERSKPPAPAGHECMVNGDEVCPVCGEQPPPTPPPPQK